MQLETGYRDAVLNLFDHEYGPRSAERRRLAIVRGLHDTGKYIVVICATALLVWVLLEESMGLRAGILIVASVALLAVVLRRMFDDPVNEWTSSPVKHRCSPDYRICRPQTGSAALLLGESFPGVRSKSCRRYSAVQGRRRILAALSRDRPATGTADTAPARYTRRRVRSAVCGHSFRWRPPGPAKQREACILGVGITAGLQAPHGGAPRSCHNGPPAALVEHRPGLFDGSQAIRLTDGRWFRNADNCLPTASEEANSVTLACAAAPTACRRSSLPSSRLTALASAAGSEMGTITPPDVSPSGRISRAPETSVITTGRPQAIASKVATGNPSWREAST